jgi:hypothetical protein
MLISDGQAISQYVRDLFASGHKSNNKLYMRGGVVSPLVVQGRSAILGKERAAPYMDKMQHRIHERNLSGQHHPKRAGTMYEIAQNILKMPVGTTSGNCVEMAAVAGYRALTTYGISKSLCYTCSVEPPGDHFFALVSENRITTWNYAQAGMNFASVREFCKSPYAKKWLVIDPWLNTVCTADTYLQVGGEKLGQWTGQGKRIHWAHSQHGPGWHEPGGEYRQAFAIAPLAIRQYTTPS